MTLVGTKEFAFPPFVSMRRLEYLLHDNRKHLLKVAAEAGRYYRPFDRRKGASDKWRHIDNPTRDLKQIQSRLYHAILETVPFDERVTGGIKGRSNRDNTVGHINQEALVTIDIKSCFPHICDEAVFTVFRKTLNYSAELASLLTKLTTFQHRLPQGAPTSSVLANLVLLPLHHRIAKVAQVYGLHWSVYVDDIAFSGMRAREAIEPTIAAITRAGLSVRADKVRVMPSGTRQKLTGIVVNKAASVGRQKVEEIRRMILDLFWREGPIFDYEIARVRGHINYVRYVNSAQGESLRSLATTLLPSATIHGTAAVRGEYHRCTSTRKHRFHANRPDRAASEVAVAQDSGNFRLPFLA